VYAHDNAHSWRHSPSSARDIRVGVAIVACDGRGNIELVGCGRRQPRGRSGDGGDGRGIHPSMRVADERYATRLTRAGGGTALTSL